VRVNNEFARSSGRRVLGLRPALQAPLAPQVPVGVPAGRDARQGQAPRLQAARLPLSLRARALDPGRGARAVPSFCAAVMTEICLCDACSCHEITGWQRPGGAAGWLARHPREAVAPAVARAGGPGGARARGAGCVHAPCLPPLYPLLQHY
jgi:hypothetical protein